LRNCFAIVKFVEFQHQLRVCCARSFYFAAMQLSHRLKGGEGRIARNMRVAAVADRAINPIMGAAGA
jgi:hypothetical protein